MGRRPHAQGSSGQYPIQGTSKGCRGGLCYRPRKSPALGPEGGRTRVPSRPEPDAGPGAAQDRSALSLCHPSALGTAQCHQHVIARGKEMGPSREVTRKRCQLLTACSPLGDLVQQKTRQSLEAANASTRGFSVVEGHGTVVLLRVLKEPRLWPGLRWYKSARCGGWAGGAQRPVLGRPLRCCGWGQKSPQRVKMCSSKDRDPVARDLPCSLEPIPGSVQCPPSHQPGAAA